MVVNQFTTSVQIFRSHNTKGYLSQVVEEFFDKKGIVHKTSCNYTHPQNGVAKRKNRHKLEVTCALLFQRGA